MPPVDFTVNDSLTVTLRDAPVQIRWYADVLVRFYHVAAACPRRPADRILHILVVFRLFKPGCVERDHRLVALRLSGLPVVCDTAAMAFNANFWLASSAAAPVIVLAAVVTLPDATDVLSFGAYRSFKATTDKILDQHRLTGHRDIEDIEHVQHYMEWAFFVWILDIVNVIGQAGLLAVSLLALAYSRAMLPAWLAIVLAVGGVLVLAFTLIVGLFLRREQENEKRQAGDSKDP